MRDESSGVDGFVCLGIDREECERGALIHVFFDTNLLHDITACLFSNQINLETGNFHLRNQGHAMPCAAGMPTASFPGLLPMREIIYTVLP
jgi:hypothetical protein